MKSMQDIFLNTVRKEKIPCTIIVTNGFQIKNALIVSFDNFSILAESDGTRQLIFKHAISSISPARMVELTDMECN